MAEIRRSQDRGYADHGWLKSYHSFSFADYHDPQHVDRAAARDQRGPGRPGARFWQDGHRDMEIISYVLEGDSRTRTRPERARDPARRRAAHERRERRVRTASRTSRSAAVHLLQIWILPNARHPRRIRGDALRRGREARPPASHRLARRRARARWHPPGRAGVCGTVRRRGARRAAGRGRPA